MDKDLQTHTNMNTLEGVYMGCKNNTTVAVSRFKTVQCVACRFFTVTLCVACRSLLSCVWIGMSDFQEKHFKIRFMRSLIVELLLKALLVSIPLQYGMDCSLLEKNKTKQNKPKNKNKKMACCQTHPVHWRPNDTLAGCCLHSLQSTQSKVWYNQTCLRVCVVQHITAL